MRRKAELNNQYRLQFGKSERNVIEAYLQREEKELMQDDKESKDN